MRRAAPDSELAAAWRRLGVEGAAALLARHVGPGWRLEIHGPGPTLVFTRAQLLAMPQHAAALPIACVEGWSTPDQHWSGLRLADLDLTEIAPVRADDAPARFHHEPRDFVRSHLVAFALS